MLSIRTSLIFVFLAFLIPFAATASKSINYSASNNLVIPIELAQWVNWVNYKPEKLCPVAYNNISSKACAWPASLSLNLNQKNGHFKAVWTMYDKGVIQLPGNQEYYPQNVMVNNEPAIVSVINGVPSVEVEKGDFTVTGEFNYKFLPSQFKIPDQTGQVSLLIKGKKLGSISNGYVFTASRKAERQDSLDVKVFRNIVDGTPMTVRTQVNLVVTGNEREIVLPSPFLQGFSAFSISSRLTSRIKKNGEIQVRLKPGKWSISLVSGQANPAELTKLSNRSLGSPYKKQQIWSFTKAKRVLDVEPVNGFLIDPRSKGVPNQWLRFPAYLMTPESHLNLIKAKKGEVIKAKNNLTLQRDVWLDFNGKGYTFKDTIQGQLHEGNRLNSTLDLGSISVNGQPRLITIDENGVSGVELSEGYINVTAESRYDSFAINGWSNGFNSVKTKLHIPPGYKVIHVTGSDNTPTNTWVNKWTLWDVFFVLIICFTVVKLYGVTWGAVSFITLALTWQEGPQFIWLNLFFAVAILSAIKKEGKLRSVLNFYKNGTLLLLTLIILGFSIQQVRVGLYPQLGHSINNYSSAQSYSTGKIAKRMVSPASVALNSMKDESVSMGMSLDSPYARESKERDRLESVDPKSNVQTGHGLPTWKSRRLMLNYERVSRTTAQNRGLPMNILMLNAGQVLALHIAQVFFLLLLLLKASGALSFLSKKKALKMKATSKLIAGSLVLMLFTGIAQADIPDQWALKQLEQKLELQKKFGDGSLCTTCAQISKAHIFADDKIIVSAEIHASARVEVPLPKSDWNPVITIDGQPALFRSNQGYLWVALEKGVHRLVMTGNADRVSLKWPLKPHLITTDVSSSWGLIETPSEIVLNRVKQVETVNAILKPSFVAPAFKVSRELNLGLDWYVTTTVTKLSRSEASEVRVKLLPGERSNEAVKDGYITFKIPSNQNSMTRRSTLKKSSSITLKAGQYVEHWSLRFSPIWSVSTDRDEDEIKNWDAWPGDTLTLSVVKPKALIGNTLTIESSKLKSVIGKQQKHVLTLNVNSTRGQKHTILLPANAIIEQVLSNGRSIAVKRLSDPVAGQTRSPQRVLLPVNNGRQKFDIHFSVNDAPGFKYVTPEINLGVSSVNQITEASMKNRWVLFTSGPLMGPAVLFWGVLGVLIVIAVGLGQVKSQPLRAWQWALLFLSLSMSSVVGIVAVIAWIFALAYRKDHEIESDWRFNTNQILLVFLTIFALIAVVFNIHHGLLGQPDMQIKGNGSYAGLLKWYQDTGPKERVAATIISAPMYVYRLIMMLVALWLSYSLINWIKWGWGCFCSPLWKKLKRKPSVTIKVKDKE